MMARNLVRQCFQVFWIGVVVAVFSLSLDTVNNLPAVAGNRPVLGMIQLDPIEHALTNAEPIAMKPKTNQLLAFKNITASELRDLNAQNSQMLLLDVRTGLEYRWKHIPGASRLQRRQILQNTPKNQPIAVICLSGHRSVPMAKWLVKQGYENVYNLKGGFWKWWRAGFPTVSGVQA